MTRPTWPRVIVGLLLFPVALWTAALSPGVAGAQERPRPGGELIFTIPSEPPSYDGHQEGTFGVVHPLAPHYNTLLRMDPWRPSTIRPRRAPPGSPSGRTNLASPFSWIYKADILARDQRWYERNVMGTGPFKFVEHRWEASKNLSRIAIVKEVAGIQVPGTPWATPPEELQKLAGYGRDIVTARAEAKRLLREAGIPEGFSFTFRNRGIPQPYEPVGIWLVDQWRQIGLNVKQETIEASAHHPLLTRGDFDVAMDFQCSFVVEPDIDIAKFQSYGVADNNFGRYKDPVLDELYLKQARAVDTEERWRHLRAFEKRLLDEEVHYIYTLQWHRIIPHSSSVRGWTITPAHFLNNQLDTVWLAEP